MAGSLTEIGKNLLLSGVVFKTIKLHSGDPTVDGSALAVPNAVGTLNMGAAASGSIASTGAVNIPVGAGVTVSHFSVWNDANPAKCLATGTLSSSQTFTTAGTYVVNTIAIDLNK